MVKVTAGGSSDQLVSLGREQKRPLFCLLVSIVICCIQKDSVCVLMGILTGCVVICNAIFSCCTIL